MAETSGVESLGLSLLKYISALENCASLLLMKIFGQNWVLEMMLIGTAFFAIACDAPNSGEEVEVSERSQQGQGLVVQQDWPLFRGDAEMQGVSQEDLKAPLELLWEFHPGEAAASEQENATGTKDDKDADSQPEKKRKVDYPIKATAVIKGGLVYLGSEESRFFCLNLTDGKKQWEFQSEGPVTGPAAVVGEQVYFGCQYGFIYALDRKTGQEKWRFESDDKIEGGVNALVMKNPATGKLQTRLFFGSYDNHLYALDATTGRLIWKYETDNYLVGTPSVVDDEQAAVIVGGCDGLLHVISALDGKELRNFDVGAYIPNSAAVRDGVAYVSHFGGEIAAYDVDAGEEVWKVSGGSGVEFYASPAVSQDRVYVGGRDKALRCLDRINGEELWRFNTRRAVDSSTVVCDSALYVGGMDGRLYAIDPKSGEELWSYEIGAKLSASPAISNGVLVISSEDGVIYGFGGGAQ